MKPAPFDYIRPRDLHSALAALAEGGESARVLAGGQSLGPMLNLRLARPQMLVDIGRIDALREVERRSSGWWSIGATATHAMLEDGIGGLNGLPRLVARSIAYRAIRNRGTLGGSLAHADPAADWPVALCALGARVVGRRARDSREINVSEFSPGAFTTCLRPDELIVAVLVHQHALQARWGYAKTARKSGEIAEAIAAVVLPERGSARIALGQPGRTARLLEGAEALLAGWKEGGGLEFLEERLRQEQSGLDVIDARFQAATLARALRQAVAVP